MGGCPIASEEKRPIGHPRFPAPPPSSPGSAMKRNAKGLFRFLFFVLSKSAALAMSISPAVIVKPGSSWIQAAAESLDDHGFCLLSSSEADAPLIPPEVCRASCDEAAARLETLLQKVERRGVDRSDEFRFAEIVHRDGLRYDLPLEWNLVSADSASAFSELHSAMDSIARRVIDAVVARRGQTPLSTAMPAPIAGCVLSVPSAQEQQWHSDGDSEGLFNVFAPLVDLTTANGPTELRPGTHTGATSGFVQPRQAPLLSAGELLMFDYRCRHRGQANDSRECRPVAYVVYSTGAEARDGNFPDAATLAWD